MKILDIPQYLSYNKGQVDNVKMVCVLNRQIKMPKYLEGLEKLDSNIPAIVDIIGVDINNQQFIVRGQAVVILGPRAFEPVKIGDAYFVDGGVKNMIPTPPIKDIGNYKHIYIILCVDDVETNREYSRIERAYRAALATMEREVTQIYEDAWDELPNVTVIHPTPYEANLLEWSKDFGLMEHAYAYTMNLLLENSNAKYT